jgi:hypothetical protein
MPDAEATRKLQIYRSAGSGNHLNTKGLPRALLFNRWGISALPWSLDRIGRAARRQAARGRELIARAGPAEANTSGSNFADLVEGAMTRGTAL